MVLQMESMLVPWLVHQMGHQLERNLGLMRHLGVLREVLMEPRTCLVPLKVHQRGPCWGQHWVSCLGTGIQMELQKACLKELGTLLVQLKVLHLGQS